MLILTHHFNKSDHAGGDLSGNGQEFGARSEKPLRRRVQHNASVSSYLSGGRSVGRYRPRLSCSMTPEIPDEWELAILRWHHLTESARFETEG